MFPGYHRFLRGLAGVQTYRAPDIPEPQLGVEFAELHQSMPLIFRYEPIATRQVDWENTAIIETYDEMSRGPAVTQDEFPSEGWLGEGLNYAF